MSGWLTGKKVAVGAIVATLLLAAGVCVLYLDSLKKVDSDNDGIKDYVEICELGTNPNKPSLVYDLNEVENAIGELVPQLSDVRSDYSNYKPYAEDVSELLQLTASLKTNVPTWIDNTWKALNATADYRITQRNLLNFFGNLTDSSLSESARLSLIRKWNESHSLNKDNDNLGKNSIYWFIKEGTEGEIKAYGIDSDLSHLQDCCILLKEGVGASNRVESILHCGKLIYLNILADCDLVEKYTWLDKLYDMPGCTGLAESKESINEAERQLSLQLYAGKSATNLKSTLPIDRCYDIEPKDRIVLNKILSRLDETSRKKLIQIIDNDDSKYSIAQLNDILDESVGYEIQISEVIANGIHAKEITNIPTLAHIADDVVAVSHEGGMKDKFYGYPDRYNYSALPQNHRTLSNIELASYILDNLPKPLWAGGEFSYPDHGITSSIEAWDTKSADCTGFTILFNIPMTLCGRKVYSVVAYALPGGHIYSLAEENENLYMCDAISATRIPIPWRQYLEGEKGVRIVFYPFLDGTLTKLVYVDGVYAERETP